MRKRTRSSSIAMSETAPEGVVDAAAPVSNSPGRSTAVEHCYLSARAAVDVAHTGLPRACISARNSRRVFGP
jgi:hypothetical protein